MKRVLQHFEEMATLRKSRSGLPVNLYLDDSGSWKKSGHFKKIKFQADTNDKPLTHNMVPMSISDDPQVLINTKMQLTSQELFQVKNFVKENKDLLLKLSDAEIDIGDFLLQMKKTI
jgi:hypothetical protein